MRARCRTARSCARPAAWCASSDKRKHLGFHRRWAAPWLLTCPHVGMRRRSDEPQTHREAEQLTTSCHPGTSTGSSDVSSSGFETRAHSVDGSVDARSYVVRSGELAEVGGRQEGRLRHHLPAHGAGRSSLQSNLGSPIRERWTLLCINPAICYLPHLECHCAPRDCNRRLARMSVEPDAMQVCELPIAMLACARIGAVHNVVFAGFSSESLAQRLQDCKCATSLIQHLCLMTDHAFAVHARNSCCIAASQSIRAAYQSCVMLSITCSLRMGSLSSLSLAPLSRSCKLAGRSL